MGSCLTVKAQRSTPSPRCLTGCSPIGQIVSVAIRVPAQRQALLLEHLRHQCPRPRRPGCGDVAPVPSARCLASGLADGLDRVPYALFLFLGGHVLAGYPAIAVAAPQPQNASVVVSRVCAERRARQAHLPTSCPPSTSALPTSGFCSSAIPTANEVDSILYSSSRRRIRQTPAREPYWEEIGTSSGSE